MSDDSTCSQTSQGEVLKRINLAIRNVFEHVKRSCAFGVAGVNVCTMVEQSFYDLKERYVRFGHDMDK